MVSAAPPAIVTIAQQASAQEHGVALYHMRRLFDVHAGPFRRHDELELAVVIHDGQTVKVRVIRASTGGKEADASGRAAIEQQYEHPKPQDLFHRPFDPRYIAEYTFTQADPLTFRFSSTMRDGSHGDGTFSLDAGDNVVKYQYTPYALPKYATSGTVMFVRAPVAANFWYITQESHHYSGRYGIFGGGADAVITYDQFKRFPDEASAITALAAGDL